MSLLDEYPDADAAAAEAAALIAMPIGPAGIDNRGPWRRVLYRGVALVLVQYGMEMGHWVWYCPEGDRFIVSDLGEGLRGYAMRTGDFEHRSLPGAFPSAGILEREGRIFACSLRGDSVCLGTEAADLPAAIVRVMLASYRLANLEGPAHVAA